MTPYTRLCSHVLFPLHEQLKGHDTTTILRDIERSQWLTADQLRLRQADELHTFLNRVCTTVPYYREKFPRPDFASTAALLDATLQRLPVTDKRLIRENFEAWQDPHATRLHRHSTSGSSGEPFQFLLSTHRISFDIAAKWRATRWWGVDIGDPEVVLWGSPLETNAQDRVRVLRDKALRSKLIPARDLGPQQIESILADIRSYRPRMLFGYPSALARIASHARQRGIDMTDCGIAVAFCTSEVLRPEWRKLIREAFSCGVANEYGARDAGFIARECPHGSLHITAEELIVEIVDEQGNPAPPGTEGDILVTNLAGPEFPFIRYRTGDRGRLASAPCPCGRGLPVLAEVTGRSNDGLVSTNGAWVHGSAVNHLMRDIRGLSAYRITQDAPGTLDIQLVLDVRLSDHDRAHLVDHTRQALGATTQVTVRQVDSIPPLANGKFRHIICNVTPWDSTATP